MKNTALSAEAGLLDRVRQVARKRSTTLNQMFRDWLAELTAEKPRHDRYDELMRRLAPVRSGRRFTRDEMNAR